MVRVVEVDVVLVVLVVVVGAAEIGVGVLPPPPHAGAARRTATAKARSSARDTGLPARRALGLVRIGNLRKGCEPYTPNTRNGQGWITVQGTTTDSVAIVGSGRNYKGTSTVSTCFPETRPWPKVPAAWMVAAW